jgi:hypothetical protein
MYKPKNDFLDPYRQGKCPVCGGADFEWGRLGGQTYYVPGESVWKWRGYQYIRTRRCLQCDNLLHFTDASLTQRQNRVMVLIIAVALALLVLAGIVLPLVMSRL